MQNGYERRRFKRLPIELSLEISKIYKQGYVVLDKVNADISVFDISKTGVGFTCKSNIPLDYYFDGRISLQDGAFFDAVIHIMRARVGENGINIYGAEFVGLAPFLANKIDEYERSLKGDSHYFYY